MTWGAAGHTPEYSSLDNHVPFPAHMQPILCTRHPHPGPTPRLSTRHAMSPASKPTAVAQFLQGGVPKHVYPLQQLPEAQVHQADNSHVPPPTIQARCPQALGNNQPYLQQNHSGDCPHCSRLWLAHSECIFEASIATQDCNENGQHRLRTSFQELKVHVQEHWIASGTSCCLCQDHFSDHLLALQLLSKVNLEDPRHWQIRMDLRQGVSVFRKHVRERHICL